MRRLSVALITLLMSTVASADEFKLQQFINNDAMIDLVRHTPKVHLFIAQKAEHTPFTAFDLNQADQFMLGTVDYSLYFDRDYHIDQSSEARFPTNLELRGSDLAVYPIDQALNQIKSACQLQDQALTSFAINRPIVQYDTIVYIFTFQDEQGYCTQSLFDSFHKTVYCQASSARCYA